MRLTDLTPGPQVGALLQAAQAWVEDDPRRNTPKRLAAFLRAQARNGPDR